MPPAQNPACCREGDPICNDCCVSYTIDGESYGLAGIQVKASLGTCTRACTPGCIDPCCGEDPDYYYQVALSTIDLFVPNNGDAIIYADCLLAGSAECNGRVTSDPHFTGTVSCCPAANGTWNYGVTGDFGICNESGACKLRVSLLFLPSGATNGTPAAIGGSADYEGTIGAGGCFTGGGITLTRTRGEAGENCLFCPEDEPPFPPTGTCVWPETVNVELSFDLPG